MEPADTGSRGAASVRSGLAVFSTTRENRIAAWNEAAERLTGIPAGEAVGRDCWDVIRGRDERGNLVCHRGCSIARLAREGWPVTCAGLCVRMPSGLDRLNLSTIVVGAGDDVLVLHPLQPVSRDAGAIVRSAPPPALTRRQHEILALLADGVRAKEIASRLSLSVSTVRNHIHALLRRLGASSQLEAVARARELGWEPPSGGARRPR